MRRFQFSYVGFCQALDELGSRSAGPTLAEAQRAQRRHFKLARRFQSAIRALGSDFRAQEVGYEESRPIQPDELSGG
jgi:hypothetical protein